MTSLTSLSQTMLLCFKSMVYISNFMFNVVVLSKHKNMETEDQQKMF